MTINYSQSLLSNAPHIIYDNKSSRDMNVMNVQTNNGLVEEVFLSNTNLITDQSRYNERVFLLGIEREPITFSIRLLFNPHTFNERNYQEIKEWLYQDTYKPFRFDTTKENDLDVFVYAIATGESKSFHNAINDGYIDFTFMTNSPYRYSPIMEDEFDFRASNSEKMRDGLYNGTMDVRRNFSLITSRLKQLSGRSDDVVFRDYKDSVDGLLEGMGDYLDTLNLVYDSLAVTKNYTGNLVSKYRAIQKRFDKLVGKVSYDVNHSVNEYSRVLAHDKKRLRSDDSLISSTSYVTSDYIEVFPNLVYSWYSARVGTVIQNPIVNFYNAKHELVDSKTYANGNVVQIIYPNNVRYIRVSGMTTTHKDRYWQVSAGRPVNYQAHSYDSFNIPTQDGMLSIISDFEQLSRDILDLSRDTEIYITAKEKDINETLSIYPQHITIYNFGQLECKPLIEIEIGKPSDIRIVNRDTNEGTTIVDNLAGEIITLKNETEQIETSRTKVDRMFFKYDSHDDNFITLRTFTNHLEVYGSCKIKFTYQFKIL